MQIYVINLDRRPDRLAHIEGQLGQLNLDFKRISAVDGQSLTDADLQNIKSDPKWPRPEKSEFACFMSHQKCWTELLQSANEYAVILEDDVLVSKDGQRFLQDAGWVPEGIDLLKLETGNIKAYYKRSGIIPINGRQLCEMKSFHFGTGGYLISRSLAEELLRISQNYIPAPIDHFLFDPDLNALAERKIYQLSPAICIQERFHFPDSLVMSGDIGGRSVFDAVTKNKPAVSLPMKIVRELKKGGIKLLRYPFDKRFVVAYE